MIIKPKLKLDKQQKKAIEAINQNHKLIMIPGKSGSGKTFLIVEMIKALNPKSGKYLAYNKKVVVEATPKVAPYGVTPSTVHSLAHKAVMGKHSTNIPTVDKYGKSYKRFIGKLTVQSISSRNRDISIPMCENIVFYLSKFFLSSSLTFRDFVKSEHNCSLTSTAVAAAVEYMKQMRTGHAPCTHDFYLKLYHAQLVSGEITPPEVDLLIIDEAGDLAQVSYAIFMAYPAKKKIMAGDPYQNIYTFNHTINAFKLAKDFGLTINLDITFRVDKKLAESIQWFCQEHIDSEFEFIGKTIEDKSIKSRMYISRTNKALISKIIEYQKAGIKFNVARKLSSIFELPLTILSLKNHYKKLAGTDYDNLFQLANLWHTNKLVQSKHSSVISYVAHMLKSDREIKSAISLIMSFGVDLFTANEYAKQLESDNTVHELTIGTVHSLKGQEADSVTLDDDLNTMVSKVIKKRRKSADDKTDMLLYYVAITRARIELINASFVDIY